MGDVRILYFASVKEQIGLPEESFAIAHEVTPADVARSLASRSDSHAAVFAELKKLRCAVNAVMCSMDTRFDAPVEIAFFPPVTGG